MSIENYKAMGFALSNAGLLQETEDQVRADHPNWPDAKVKDERNKRLKARTLFTDENKKPKKAKK